LQPCFQHLHKSVICNVDKPVLDEAAEVLKQQPSVKIYVNGYCDAIATVPYNLKLSQRRAEAVSAYLEDKGIPASQLIPQGFGKSHFVATNRTRDGRAQNRRVELIPTAQ
jgi:OmpA-OmpF porin, OOP family